MNERREIRLRLLEVVGRDGNQTADMLIETVLGLERFIWDADVHPESDYDFRLRVLREMKGKFQNRDDEDTLIISTGEALDAVAARYGFARGARLSTGNFQLDRDKTQE